MKNILLIAMSFSLSFMAGCSKKSTEIVYSHVKITSIKITDMSFFKANGDTWDNDYNPRDVYPDVFITINNPDGSVAAKSATDANVQPIYLPLVWPLTPFYMDDITKKYSINLWDDDSDRSRADEFIDGYYFLPNDYKSGYPKTIILQNPTHTLRIELTVEWY